MKLQGIFKKIHVSDRKKLLKLIAEEKVSITCRHQETKFHVLASLYREDEKLLVCLPTQDNPESLDADCVMHFEINDQQYFFTSYLSRDSINRWQAPAAVDFYVLQRRSSSRIEVPPEYPALFRIQKYNAEASFTDTKVVDVSAGGLKLKLKGSSFVLKNGDLVEGVLRLGTRTPIQLKGEVRYIEPSSDGGKTQVFGVMFLGVSKILENKLLTVLMSFQHELFKLSPN